MDWKFSILCASLLLFGCLERRWPCFQLPRRFSEQMRSNVLLGVTNTLAVSLTTKLLLTQVCSTSAAHGLLGNLDQFGQPWLVVLISFLVLDLYLYCWHRTMHKFPFAWRFHRVHHSDAWMNVSTAYRVHTLEVLASHLPRVAIIWFLGIPLQVFWAYEAVLTVVLIFHHSNWQFPARWDRWLSWLIVTPHYHRVHHACEFEHISCNYGSVLSIWDRIFNSCLYPQANQRFTLGLRGERPNPRFRQLLRSPFA